MERRGPVRRPDLAASAKRPEANGEERPLADPGQASLAEDRALRQRQLSLNPGWQVKRAGPFLVAAVAALVTGCSVPPSDAQLIRTFQAHRQIFEQLSARACAFGHYQNIGLGFVEPHLEPSEINWFRDRMGEIGVDSLSVHGLGKECQLTLGVWADGFAGTPSSYKNYYFGPQEGQVVSNLDHPKFGDQIVTLTRPIGSNWSLEYIWYP